MLEHSPVLERIAQQHAGGPQAYLELVKMLSRGRLEQINTGKNEIRKIIVIIDLFKKKFQERVDVLNLNLQSISGAQTRLKTAANVDEVRGIKFNMRKLGFDPLLAPDFHSDQIALSLIALRGTEAFGENAPGVRAWLYKKIGDNKYRRPHPLFGHVTTPYGTPFEDKKVAAEALESMQSRAETPLVLGKWDALSIIRGVTGEQANAEVSKMRRLYNKRILPRKLAELDRVVLDYVLNDEPGKKSEDSLTRRGLLKAVAYGSETAAIVEKTRQYLARIHSRQLDFAGPGELEQKFDDQRLDPGVAWDVESKVDHEYSLEELLLENGLIKVHKRNNETLEGAKERAVKEHFEMKKDETIEQYRERINADTERAKLNATWKVSHLQGVRNLHELAIGMMMGLAAADMNGHGGKHDKASKKKGPRSVFHGYYGLSMLFPPGEAEKMKELERQDRHVEVLQHILERPELAANERCLILLRSALEHGENPAESEALREAAQHAPRSHTVHEGLPYVQFGGTGITTDLANIRNKDLMVDPDAAIIEKITKEVMANIEKAKS